MGKYLVYATLTVSKYAYPYNDHYYHAHLVFLTQSTYLILSEYSAVSENSFHYESVTHLHATDDPCLTTEHSLDRNYDYG